MRVRLAVVLAVTAVCLVAALWGIEVEKAHAALMGASWSRVAGALAIYLAAHSLRAIRLGLLVGGDLPFRRLFLINTVGFLAINVIPLRLGEAVRPWLLAEREGLALGRAIAGIFLERLLDMMMLLAMLLGLTLVLELPAGGVVVGGVDVVRAGQTGAGAIVLGGTVFGGLVVAGGPRVMAPLERLPLGALLVRLASRFREGIAVLVQQPRVGLSGVGISVLIWAVTVGAVWLTLTAFEGLPTTLAAAWTTWSVTISGMAAVPTAGFFGVYEACCAAALALWSVDVSLAQTFAVVLHLSQFGFIVVVGGAALVIEGLSVGDLIRVEPPVAPELSEGTSALEHPDAD